MLRMKSFFLLLLNVAVAICFTACGQSGQPVGEEEGLTFDSIVVDTMASLTRDPNSPRAELHLSVIYAKGKNADVINDSLLRSGILNLDCLPIGKKRISPQEVVDSFVINYFEDYKTDFGALYRMDPEHTANYNAQYVTYANISPSVQGVATYIADVYYYAGGLHGHHLTIVKNIDLESGRILKLSDVVVAGAAEELLDMVVGKLCKKYDAKDLKELQQQGVFTMVDPYLPDSFILNQDGSLTFVYSDSEIASHTEGEIRVEISSGEMKPLLKEP